MAERRSKFHERGALPWNVYGVSVRPGRYCTLGPAAAAALRLSGFGIIACVMRRAGRIALRLVIGGSRIGSTGRIGALLQLPGWGCNATPLLAPLPREWLASVTAAGRWRALYTVGRKPRP